jgi:hypothetical protein
MWWTKPKSSPLSDGIEGREIISYASKAIVGLLVAIKGCHQAVHYSLQEHHELAEQA